MFRSNIKTLQNAPAVTVGLTAFATGGQASATALPSDVNVIAVCATGGDSALLPAVSVAGVGATILVSNQGAASCNVFPATGDLVNSGAANAAFAVGIAKSAVFTAVAAGKWVAVLSA